MLETQMHPLILGRLQVARLVCDCGTTFNNSLKSDCSWIKLGPCTGAWWKHQKWAMTHALFLLFSLGWLSTVKVLKQKKNKQSIHSDFACAILNTSKETGHFLVVVAQWRSGTNHNHAHTQAFELDVRSANLVLQSTCCIYFYIMRLYRDINRI